ncbi:MAG: 50S ribosomal protein L32 [bacterium]
MANPKRIMSRAKTRHRRSTWKARLKAPNLNYCPNCDNPKLPHTVCPNCGYYDGRQVIVIEE